MRLLSLIDSPACVARVCLLGGFSPRNAFSLLASGCFCFLACPAYACFGHFRLVSLNLLSWIRADCGLQVPRGISGLIAEYAFEE
jgi:hypothetical protein